MRDYARQRFDNNLGENIFPSEGKYQIPIIWPETYEPTEWIPMSSASTAKSFDCGLHFFIDDYRFERVWHYWQKYAEIFGRFNAILTPDFSMFTDWPVAAQIWNHFRKHFVGAYMQNQGLKVYPTISWSDRASYEWCFDGEPEHSTVAVSSVGTQKHTESKRLFQMGYDAMLERLHPETILFYGDIPKGCKGNIMPIKPFQKRFEKGGND